MAEPSHMFSKIVQSGEVVEAYIYSNSIKVGHKREHEVGRRKKSDLDDEGLEVRRKAMKVHGIYIWFCLLRNLYRKK